MLRSMFRCLSQALVQPGQQRLPLVSQRCSAAPCRASAVGLSPLLRPGVCQLRQASVQRSSLFGWEQVPGSVRSRLRTAEHSWHHDPLLRQVATSSSSEPRGSTGPASPQQRPDGGKEAAAPASISSLSTSGSSDPDDYLRSLDEVAAAFVAQQAAAEAAAAAAKAAAEGQQSSAGAHGNGAHAAGGSGHGGFHEGLDPSGKPLPEWKLRLGRYLESNECHVIIIWLVMLDLTIVVTELILGSLFSHGQPMPHAVHLAEEILSWSSIGILGIFALELLAKLVCFGGQYFAHSRWHMFDAVVVTLSLGLELTLKGVAGEAASLLMFFRLWKYTPEFMRVARHAPEVAEVARVARHTPEIARILSHTPEFLRVFRHTPEFLRVFRHIPEFFRFVRHTPELFRLWRVARIAHASAEAMALHTAKESEEQRHAMEHLRKELAVERGRVRVLETEVSAMKQFLTPEQQAQVMAELLKSVPGASARTSHSMHSRTAMDRVWEEGLAGVEHPGQHHYHHHHHKGHHHTETPAGEVQAALGQPLSEEHNNGKPGQGNGAEH